MIDVTPLIGSHDPVGDEERLPVEDPATGERIGSVPVGDPRDVDRAVALATEAASAWSGASVHERAAVLHALADVIESNLDELARIESRDQGKPLSLARDLEIPRAAANLRFFADAIRQDRGEFFDLGGQGLNYTLRRPHGVAGCISPWNLPLYLFTWKIAPALATGNTVVAKPSEIEARCTRPACASAGTARNNSSQNATLRPAPTNPTVGGGIVPICATST